MKIELARIPDHKDIEASLRRVIVSEDLSSSTTWPDLGYLFVDFLQACGYVVEYDNEYDGIGIRKPMKCALDCKTCECKTRG